MKLFLLMLTCFAMGLANRVYIHPFSLLDSGDVTCEFTNSKDKGPLETIRSLTPIQDGTEPDPRPTIGELKNLTRWTAVVAELQNSQGLRMYQALSRKQEKVNVLFSPYASFATLLTLYLGTSKSTANDYQQFLGLIWNTEKPGCVKAINGHKVLRALNAISSVIDGPQDELRTRVWTFVSSDADLSKDFVRGIQEFTDTSFIRAVNFSQPKEAEAQVNLFIQKTSHSKVENLFKDISQSTNLLFATSVHFKGNWRTAFQPEKTTVQDFQIDDMSTVKVPLMTHTGDYMHLNDPDKKCTVVKLGLSKRTYMLLVLPSEKARLQDIENQLQADTISTWHKHLKEQYLELSLPKFSLTAVTDLRSLLSDMALDKLLLGSEANFQRFSTKGNFTIDKVINKVLFEMSEERKEVPNKSQDDRVPLRVTVDRPFLFTIVEGNTNAILMLGRILNPNL
ncbi:angiotensinogen [Ictalurus punctatus]|uniref:Angiotensinogen n=1 Tax=Ictalurus punctatus TaxID=7998 RepID=A0A2D0QNI3_ICTPU|nr:angiotensinogen [Ictalurus punctatus]